MMALGVDFAVVCLDTISDQTDRDALVNILHETGKEVIEIDLKQMEQFAGNMLQVASHNGSNYIVMSEAARAALKKSQIAKLEQFTNILAIPIPTIEKYGGGSVRCMMAEIFPAV